MSNPTGQKQDNLDVTRGLDRDVGGHFVKVDGTTIRFNESGELSGSGGSSVDLSAFEGPKVSLTTERGAGKGIAFLATDGDVHASLNIGVGGGSMANSIIGAASNRVILTAEEGPMTFTAGPESTAKLQGGVVTLLATNVDALADLSSADGDASLQGGVFRANKAGAAFVQPDPANVISEYGGGGAPQMANMAPATNEATVVAKFNILLDYLKNRGTMVSDE